MSVLGNRGRRTALLTFTYTLAGCTRSCSPAKAERSDIHLDLQDAAADRLGAMPKTREKQMLKRYGGDVEMTA